VASVARHRFGSPFSAIEESKALSPLRSAGALHNYWIGPEGAPAVPSMKNEK